MRNFSEIVLHADALLPRLSLLSKPLEQSMLVTSPYILGTTEILEEVLLPMNRLQTSSRALYNEFMTSGMMMKTNSLYSRGLKMALRPRLVWKHQDDKNCGEVSKKFWKWSTTSKEQSLFSTSHIFTLGAMVE